MNHTLYSPCECLIFWCSISFKFFQMKVLQYMFAKNYSVERNTAMWPTEKKRFSCVNFLEDSHLELCKSDGYWVTVEVRAAVVASIQHPFAQVCGDFLISHQTSPVSLVVLFTWKLVKCSRRRKAIGVPWHSHFTAKQRAKRQIHFTL